MTLKLKDATVAIFGLGLMGGSLGLALAGKCARRIGVVRDVEMVEQAEKSGAVDEVVDMEEAFPIADIVVLAVPVRDIAFWVPHAAARMREGALLTDLGSTKGEIVAAMDGISGNLRAVGGHPMCGKETGGLANADASLFCEARYVLTETARSDESAIDLARQLALAVGAVPVLLDAERHDRAVGAASHLPYVMAQCLVHAFMDAERAEPYVAELAASGFRDTTRVAAGDVTMWHDILLTNADSVRDAMGRLDRQMQQLRSLLEDDPAKLRGWLAAGQRRRQAFAPPAPSD